MRYCLVILVLCLTTLLSLPAAAELPWQTVRGRLVAVERQGNQLVLELEGSQPQGDGRQLLTVSCDQLPAGLQLGDQLVVEGQTVAGGLFQACSLTKSSRWGNNRDQTGVRSRLKKAQRAGGGGQGSGRGRN